MGNYFICKGLLLNLYDSLMKEADACSAKAKSLQPQAAKDYAEAMVRWNSWDFAKAECYHPRHCYDEIRSLKNSAQELRDKAKKLQAWIDTFTWIKYPEGERADCSKKQSDFVFKAVFEYRELIERYHPK
jgi:hypothetical protein